MSFRRLECPLGSVKGDWIKEGAVVIDVGINVDKDGNICGDVRFDECENKAKMITPVPGGVGSVTTSVLAKHVVQAAKQLNNIYNVPKTPRSIRLKIFWELL